MCIICVEMDKKKLSPWEAKNNLTEMVEKIGPEHAREVQEKISQAIYDEIFFNFGDTIEQEAEIDEFGQLLTFRDQKSE